MAGGGGGYCAATATAEPGRDRGGADERGGTGIVGALQRAAALRDGVAGCGRPGPGAGARRGGHPMREDAWLAPPGAAAVRAYAEQNDCAFADAFRRMERLRERTLQRIVDDPYRYGLEPSCWWVADALEDFPFCTVDTERTIRDRTG